MPQHHQELECHSQGQKDWKVAGHQETPLFQWANLTVPLHHIHFFQFDRRVCIYYQGGKEEGPGQQEVHNGHYKAIVFYWPQ